jgi:hypothetical protein
MYFCSTKNEKQEIMKASNFEIGKSYGNDLTIEIISRTEKTATIKTVFGTQKVKVRKYNELNEIIYFKCWSICATDEFEMQKATEIAYYNAYCK